MEYIAYLFGIFGLMAYLEMSSLKKRIKSLEDQLSRMNGTSYAEEKRSLKKIVTDLTGRDVVLQLKEDEQDADIMMYGNTKHGSNIIKDVDEEWVLLTIVSAKKSVDKLIRISSIARIEAK